MPIFIFTSTSPNSYVASVFPPSRNLSSERVWSVCLRLDQCPHTHLSLPHSVDFSGGFSWYHMACSARSCSALLWRVAGGRIRWSWRIQSCLLGTWWGSPLGEMLGFVEIVFVVYVLWRRSWQRHYSISIDGLPTWWLLIFFNLLCIF